MEAKTEELVKLLGSQQFTLHSEIRLHSEIGDSLAKAGIWPQYEYSLDKKNRVDFFHNGTAIEIKVKGNAKAIYKQCVRYCNFDEVKALILVTNRSMGFPPEINGKPCYVVKLGKGWL